MPKPSASRQACRVRCVRPWRRLGVSADEAESYLTPQLRDLLPDPRSLKDMEPAAARFLQAVEARQKIAVFADYDVDGGSSAALLIDWLRQMGLTSHALCARPHRRRLWAQ